MHGLLSYDLYVPDNVPNFRERATDISDPQNVVYTFRLRAHIKYCSSQLKRQPSIYEADRQIWITIYFVLKYI